MIHPVPKPERRVKPPKEKKPRTKLNPKNKERAKKAFVEDFGGKAYLDFIHGLPCDICGVTGYTVAAHLKSRGSGGHADVLAPLCDAQPNGDIGCHRRYDLYDHVARAHEPRLRELAKARRSAFLFALEKSAA